MLVANGHGLIDVRIPKVKAENIGKNTSSSIIQINTH